MKTVLTLLLFAASFCFGQEVKTLQNDREFSYKIYGNIANYFESEKDLLDFFEFEKGDVVAEVGAGNWQNMAGLSILTDSITFYAEDIIAGNLSEKDLAKALSKTEKYKQIQTNTFKLQIGNEKETLLPDNTFDKIILSATFHELTYMDEMISNIYKKLKPGGQLYILESECLSKTHKNYTSEQAFQIVQKHNFNFVKKDGKDINGAKDLYRLVLIKN